eukprot:CAMPEP_0178978668 /NCGR_PEP_ID=MMETSP0789-20121207/25340_1 /TAXON_ID=3005 /ORGANISM="Rhizosolenia setigera, Strain CCMP 1694" /LENGTH=440 /DNA_ID=CAMNT_0020668539 /DNA_START=583 /DNA_END=1905 /DNA_ORIENTATION=+
MCHPNLAYSRSVSYQPGELGGPSPIGIKPPSMLGKSPCMPISIPRPQFKRINKTNSVLDPISNNVPLWTVAKSVLTEVPEGYTVTRTSRFIPDTDPSIISSRVSNALKQRSVQTEYCSRKAKAICMNAEMIKYHVQLYRGKGSRSDGVVVEIRRLDGSGRSFFQDSKAILNAAEGDYDSCQPRQIKKRSSYGTCDARQVVQSSLRRPVSEISSLKKCKLSTHEEEKKATAEGIDVVTRLLQDPYFDTNVMGMRALCSLLNTQNACTHTVSEASKAVLCGSNNPVIFNSIASLLERGTLPRRGECGSSSSTETKKQAEEEKVDGECYGELRNLALVAVSSALAFVEKSEHNRYLLSDEKSWLMTTLIPILVKILDEVESDPHCAYHALMIVKKLCSMSDAVKSLACESGVHRSLVVANSFGRQRCEKIAMESSDLMKSFEG